MDNHWFFPRTDLAKHIMNVLEMGLSTRITLFAPRRKGKTHFLLKDLAPLATKEQYIVVYSSLWSHVNQPHKALIDDLRECLELNSKKNAIQSLLQSKIKSISLGSEILGQGELIFADEPEKPSSHDIQMIGRLIGSLSQLKKRKKVLLLIDEVQHLTTCPYFEAIGYALRTAIDKHSDKVYAIFTGSSRQGMSLLFNDSHSAFYQFAEQLKFPDLGDDYIAFIQKKLMKHFKINMKQEDLAEAFTSLDQSPFWFSKAMHRIILLQSNTIQEATQYVLDLRAETENYPGLFQRLKPLERMVYLAVVRGVHIYSKEQLVLFSATTESSVHRATVQRAVEKLIALHLISKTNHGEYHSEKPGFTRFCENALSVK